MNADAKTLRERLEGALIPAVPVPFDEEGNHRPEAEETLVKYHSQSPAQGVAVWVHTGRGLMLSHGERHAVFKRWRAGLAPGQFILAGAGCSVAGLDRGYDELSDDDYIARSAAMAEDAKRYGADGVVVHPPTKFRGRPDQDEKILAHHDAIASAGLPMVLFYLYEAAGGISYSPALLKRLLEHPAAAGIKLATLDSVMTYQDAVALVKETAPEAAILTGEDRFLGYSFMAGAQGALIGMAAVEPQRHFDLIKAWRERKMHRFVELSAALDNLSRTLFVQPMEGYIRRVMIALASEGVLPAEATFDPWGPPVPHQRRIAIAAALQRLKDVD